MTKGWHEPVAGEAVLASRWDEDEGDESVVPGTFQAAVVVDGEPGWLPMPAYEVTFEDGVTERVIPAFVWVQDEDGKWCHPPMEGKAHA